MSDELLARKVRDHLANDPGATVQDIASALDVEEPEIVTVLDEWMVKKKGGVEHVGPGGGGGWVSAAEEV